jgi:hypothetical protein
MITSSSSDHQKGNVTIEIRAGDPPELGVRNI